MKMFLFWGLALSMPIGLFSQSGILDQYVVEALAHNPDLARSRIGVQQQQARLDKAKGLFLPQVDFRASYILAAGGRSIQFPIGDLLNPVYSTLNQLTETQGFPTDLANVNERFLPNNFQETSIRVIQPIFSSDILVNKRAQEALLQVSETSVQVATTSLVREVREAYWSYLQALEQVAIYEEVEALLREQLRVNERLVAANKVTVDAISQAQVSLSQWTGDMAQARQQEASARAYVNLLLGRDLREPLQQDSSLRPGAWRPDLELLLGQATAQRSETQWIDQQNTAQSWGVQQARGQMLPSLSLVTDLGFQGFGYDFGNDQAFVMAQASLNWNLFQGGQRRAGVQEAKLASEAIHWQSVQLHRQIALEVEQAWYGWQAAEQAFLATQEGEGHAARLYRQTAQRFQEGQINALQLEQVRAAWTQSQLALNAAKYEWLRRETTLQFAAGLLKIPSTE